MWRGEGSHRPVSKTVQAFFGASAPPARWEGLGWLILPSPPPSLLSAYPLPYCRGCESMAEGFQQCNASGDLTTYSRFEKVEGNSNRHRAPHKVSNNLFMEKTGPTSCTLLSLQTMNIVSTSYLHDNQWNKRFNFKFRNPWRLFPSRSLRLRTVGYREIQINNKTSSLLGGELSAIFHSQLYPHIRRWKIKQLRWP